MKLGKTFAKQNLLALAMAHAARVHVLLVFAALVTVALFFLHRAFPSLRLDPDLFLAIYIPSEVLRVGICLHIVTIRLITRRFGLDLQSFMIALAFLPVAILNSYRLIANVLLPFAFSVEISSQVMYFRSVSGWLQGAFMLIAFFLPSNTTISRKQAYLLFGSSILIATFSSHLIWRYGAYFPDLFVEGQGPTAVASMIGYPKAALFTVLTFLYGVASAKRVDSSLFFIAAAMAAAIPTEFAYLLIESGSDSFKLISNLIGTVSFIFIFVALVQQTLLRPYLELELSQRDLITANKELETFAYSASHDLKAPLRSIKAFGNFLAQGASGKLNDEEKEYLDRIQAGSEKMSELIDGLLQLSRISKQEMFRVEVDLSEIVNQVVTELRQTDRERKAEFSIQKNVIAHADPKLMNSALRNLIGNAWKYSSKKEYARIEFGVLDSDRLKTYFVRDNGAGFDMRYVNQLFEPFKRLHTEREFPGSGIGLATVRRIIERHGGTIRAESEPGNGAVFYFTLG